MSAIKLVLNCRNESKLIKYCIFDILNTAKNIELCNTEWDQRYPYNKYCPMDGDRRSLAGCVPVAVAQILLFHESYPDGYDWDILKKTKLPTPSETTIEEINEGKDLAAKLIREIGKEIDTKYSADASSSYDYKAAKYLAKGFNFYENNNFWGIPKLLDYNAGSVIYSLGNKISPVYISGSKPNADSGHAWVISGYKEFSQTNKLLYYGQVISETTQIWDKVHHNYGWGGYKNEYLSADILGDYTEGVKIIPSLRRK